MRPEFWHFFGVVSLLLALTIVTLSWLGRRFSSLHSASLENNSGSRRSADRIRAKNRGPAKHFAIAEVEAKHRSTKGDKSIEYNASSQYADESRDDS